MCRHAHLAPLTETAFRAAKAVHSIIPHALNGPWSSTPRRRDATPLPSPSMISATPRLLLDALDGQREDRLHRGSAAINVQQLAGEEAVVAGARTDDVHRDALLGESDREITSQRLLRGFR